ncbi:MAG TPA: nitrilase-related carbon-nitrogen hydrolase [Syntrophorhabdaceae bacterium]|jgi:predicted amidohydrolase
MKIAGIQFACSKDKEKNTEKALKIMDMALEEGARIICFQELFNLPWFPKEKDESAFALAETVDGETVRKIQERMKSAEGVVILPIFEKEGDKYYNSAVVLDKGSVTGVYRKIHLPHIPLWEEKFFFSSGDRGFPVFETSEGKIGIQISWDNLVPEGPRILALKGADIVFAPTACAFKSQHIWQTVISGNAIANGVYMMRVNRAGSEEAQDFYGMSFCVNPEGEIIGGPTGGGDSLLLADVDFEYLKEFRREWPLMKERKPLLYKEILTESP